MSETDDCLQKLLLSNICKHWDDGLYCDVTIICGADSVKAHKLVLSSISDYFKSLFQHENDNTYSLDETIVSGSCICDIIVFAQTGEIVLDIDSAQELFIPANYLQIDLIKNKYDIFIQRNLHKYNNENIIPLMNFADMYHFTSLMKPICCRISENFYQMTEHELFYELPVIAIKSLLANENLTVFNHGIPVGNPEYEILKALGMYLSKIECDDRTRSYLMEEICFDEFKNPKDLKSIVKKHPKLDCEKIQEIICALESISLKNDLDFTSQSDQKTRKYSNKNKSIYEGSEHLISIKQMWKLDSTIINDVTNRPVQFTIWVISIPDHSVTIGGILIRYQNRTKVVYKREHADEDSTTEHTFSLKEGEVITKVQRNCGVMLNRITFFSNFGKIYGPFGSNSTSIYEKCSPSKRGYLHSLSVANTNLGYEVISIKFHWIRFRSEETSLTDVYVSDDDEDDYDTYSDSDNSDD